MLDMGVGVIAGVVLIAACDAQRIVYVTAPENPARKTAAAHPSPSASKAEPPLPEPSFAQAAILPTAHAAPPKPKAIWSVRVVYPAGQEVEVTIDDAAPIGRRMLPLGQGSLWSCAYNAPERSASTGRESRFVGCWYGSRGLRPISRLVTTCAPGAASISLMELTDSDVLDRNEKPTVIVVGCNNDV